MGHRRGGRQPDRVTDLADARGVTAFVHRGPDDFEHLALADGEIRTGAGGFGIAGGYRTAAAGDRAVRGRLLVSDHRTFAHARRPPFVDVCRFVPASPDRVVRM